MRATDWPHFCCPTESSPPEYSCVCCVKKDVYHIGKFLKIINYTLGLPVVNFLNCLFGSPCLNLSVSFSKLVTVSLYEHREIYINFNNLMNCISENGFSTRLNLCLLCRYFKAAIWSRLSWSFVLDLSH